MQAAVLDEVEMTGGHVPVMLDRVVELIAPVGGIGDPPTVVDTTLGAGGHTAAMLARIPRLRVIGLDADQRALEATRRRLADHADRLELVHARYDALPAVLSDLGLTEVSGVLFDLGVSSMQLDEPDRGFAYRRDDVLDMRMDAGSGLTAADVLNSYSVDDLTRILREYGEERYARPIARRIVAERASAEFSTAGRLVELLHEVIPAASQRSGGHPAKRTFQALRIEVNAELATLERALPAATNVLAPSGRIVVLAYHSLEDRLVKRWFGALSRPNVPSGVPDVPLEFSPVLQQLTRGAERPDDAEVATNPRAASARLRAATRIRSGVVDPTRWTTPRWQEGER